MIITGTAIINENDADVTRLRPDESPPIMVMAERLIPGHNDKHCQHPILNA